jgi:hypothetical protein
MVQLPEDIVEDLENNPDDASRSALPVGHYLLEVVEIKEEPASTRAGTSGFGKLLVVSKVVQPRAHKGHKVWDRLSYSPQARWKLRSFYDAVGYEYSSDTDEIVEAKEQFVAYMEAEIIENGAKKGQLGDNVSEMLPATEENLSVVDD